MNTKKIRKKCFSNKFLSFICFKISPLLGANFINSNINEEIQKKKNINDLSFYKVGLTVEKLEELQKKELERKKIIEDKAKTNVIGVTIALTLFSTLITSFNGTKTNQLLTNSNWTWFLLIDFLIIIIYFAMSGFSALQSLELKVVFDLYLGDEIELATKGDTHRIAKMIKNIELNYLITPQREAYLNASYQCIRNAIYALLILFVIISLIILDNVVFSEQVLYCFNLY